MNLILRIGVALSVAVLVSCLWIDPGQHGPKPRSTLLRLLDADVRLEVESHWSPASDFAHRDFDHLPPSFQQLFEGEWHRDALIDVQPRPFRDLSTDSEVEAPIEPCSAPRACADAAHSGALGLRFDTPSGAVAWIVPLTADTPYFFTGAVRRHRSPMRKGAALRSGGSQSWVAPDDDLTRNALVGRILLLELHEPPSIEPGADVRPALLAALEKAPARHALDIGAPDGVFDQGQTIFRSSVYARAALIVLIAGNPLWWLRGDAENPGDQAPPTPVDFDDLRLLPLPLKEYLPLQDQSTADDLRTDPSTSSSANVRKVKIVGDVRRALLCACPTRATFTVSPSPGELRIHWSAGILEERRTEWGRVPVEVRLLSRQDEQEWCTVDTLALLPVAMTLGGRRVEVLEDHGWQDRTSLLQCQGGRIEIAFTVDSTSPCDDILAIGEPTLHSIDPSISAPRPSLILISLDTLRSDHLGCYGYRRDDGLQTSPNLDAFAERSLRFAQMRSVAPYTLPAHATLMTGLHPTAHGVLAAGRRLVGGVHPLIAERLAEAGYATAAFTGGGLVSYEHGFHHGFDRYSILDPLMTIEDPLRDNFPRFQDRAFNDRMYARRRLDAAFDWIVDQDRTSFFLFLHSYVVHNYRPPANLRKQFMRSDQKLLGAEQNLHQIDREAARRGVAVDAEVSRALIDLYDATLRHADEQVGEFLRRLEEEGVLENAVVVITSDHGEEFGEHQGLLHGRTLYEEMTAVPLIVHAPGLEPGVIDEPVDLADVAPTLLNFAGLVPAPGLHGEPLTVRLARKSFRPFLWHEVDAPNLTRRFACRVGPFKLIYNPEDAREVKGFESRRPPLFELFDLSTDKGELHNLMSYVRSGTGLPELAPQEQQPVSFSGLRERLQTWHQELEAACRTLVQAFSLHRTVSEEERRQLQSLGYMIEKQDG